MADHHHLPLVAQLQEQELALVQELGTAERYTAARPGEHTAVLVSPADMAVQGLLQELYHLDDDRGV